MVATSVADVVSSAGGWLFDRRALGWDVDVLLPEPIDSRPLRILGLNVVDCGGEFSAVLGAPIAGIAVAAERMVDAEVRRCVRKAVRSGFTEVALWGQEPPNVSDRMDVVGYRPSRAAEAFKCVAVEAAGLPPRLGAQTEVLYRFGSRPMGSDLTIVSHGGPRA